LRELFHDMPRLNASILLVQHMPGFINESVRATLDAETQMDVLLAQDGVAIERGVVYIAPTGVHMKLVKNHRIRLAAGPKVNYVCPAIDVTMQSLVREPKFKFFGVVLTGMGDDGAAGIVHIKRLRGVTFSQNQETCRVYGMPKVAAATGCVDFVMRPVEIRDKLIELVGAPRIRRERVPIQV